MVDCLVLRNGEKGVCASEDARVRISGASSRIQSNGGFGLYSYRRGSIKVSGLGTKPAFTRQDDDGTRIFSGATTSALFSKTEDHPNTRRDVGQHGSGPVAFVP